MKTIQTMMLWMLDLQLFANAGDVVNTTGGTANAHTGAVSTNTAMDPTMKTYYETQLLENAKPDRVYAQFAQRQGLPANHGETVEWRKWNTFDKADKLVEGVIPTGQQFGQSKIVASIDQYGTYTAISDRLDMHAYDPVILGASEEMGSSFAATEEWLIREGLMVGTNVLYCDNIKADGTKVGATPTSCAQLGDSETNGYAYLTADMVAKAATVLKKMKAPKINGYYYAVVHHSVAEDLRKSKGWVSAHEYAAPGEIFSGEIGELHGVRFVESADSPVLGGEDYQNKEGTVTYATFFFAKAGYGIIDPAEGGMEMIVKSADQIGGPLNQFSTVGYKFETNGATILYPERVLRVMSTSSYSAVDEAQE
jgi:N4-gp56 family major capsid protein